MQQLQLESHLERRHGNAASCTTGHDEAKATHSDADASDRESDSEDARAMELLQQVVATSNSLDSRDEAADVASDPSDTNSSGAFVLVSAVDEVHLQQQ